MFVYFRHCSSSLWLSLDSTTILQDIFSIPLFLAPNYKNCCKEVDEDNWSRLLRLMVFPIYQLILLMLYGTST